MTAPNDRDPIPQRRRAGGPSSDGPDSVLGTLLSETVVLPVTGRAYDIVRPGDTDLLLDRVVADPEQNLPYWAEIWPSGIALADAITGEPELVRGKRVFEIGSGLGVTAIAVAEQGASLVVSDYAAESLRLCRENVRCNTGVVVDTVHFNWRRPDDGFWDESGAPFAVVLAADVLYEARDVEPLLALIERIVAPDGLLWLAEPGRGVADSFLEMIRRRGWRGPHEQHHGPWPDPKDDGVVVTVHRLTRHDA